MFISRGSILGYETLIQFMGSENEIAKNLVMEICYELKEVSKRLYTMIRNLDKE